MIPTWLPNKDRTHFEWRVGTIVFDVSRNGDRDWWLYVNKRPTMPGVTSRPLKQYAVRVLDDFLLTGNLP